MRHYLDANSTLPCLDLVKFAQKFSGDANPSSLHWDGQLAKKILSDSKEVIAKYFEVDPYDCFFVSCATEGLTQIIQGFAEKTLQSTIAYSNVDHTAVLKNIERLQEKKIAKTIELKVNSQGEIKDLVPCDLLVVTAANNETGVLFDLELLKKYHAQGTKILLDAVQLIGKYENNKEYFELAHAIVISGHKIGAPKGIGFVVNKSLEISPLILGGKQERNRRGGTENLFGIFCLGEVFKNLPKFNPEYRFELEKKLVEKFPNVQIHGKNSKRISNTVNFHIPGFKPTVLMFLDNKGFSVSLGSACASGAIGPSHVIMALTQDEVVASASIRVSFPSEVDPKTIDLFLEALQQYFVK